MPLVRHRSVSWILAASWISMHAWGSAAYAQEPAVLSAPESAQETMTALGLADLEPMALANNPTVEQAAAEVERARGLCIQAGLYPNPVVGYVGGEIGNEGKAGQQGGFLAQQIVTAGKLRLDQAVAQHQLEQAEARLDAQQRRVLGAVQISYYDVLSARRSLEIAVELQAIAENAARVARELFNAGEAGRGDVLLAEIETSKAQVVVANTRNRSAASWRRLTAVVGMPSLPPAELEGTLDEEVADLQWEAVWQQLADQSPEIRTALSGVPRAVDSLRRAEVEPIPNVQLQAIVQHDAATRDTITSVQVGVALPIFNRNQGNVRAAHADVHRARQEVDRVELDLRSRLSVAFQRYESARQQVAAYRDEIVPKARESLDLAREGYRRQQFDFLQVLTAQRTFFETRLAYVEALAELKKSVAAIENMLLADGLAEGVSR